MNHNINLLKIVYDVYDVRMDKLKTGDIIICHSNKNKDDIDNAIEFFNKRHCEHTGMIIRDPWWCPDVPKGVYIFQSGDGSNGYFDILNGKVKGITLNRLDDFLANRKGVYVRSLSGINMCEVNKNIFVENFQIAHGKPYDPNVCSRIGKGLGSFCNCICLSRKTTQTEKDIIRSSPPVAFMYVKMKWIAPLDWSCQTPDDISNWTLPAPYKLEQPWLLK